MISMYFGSPGSGKTTMANRLFLLHRIHKSYDHYFANFDTKLAQSIDISSLGRFTLPPHSLLIVDEAGIAYNNRKFKSMSQELISWFKLHRHYQVDVIIVSQSWDDVDITLRRLVDQLFYIRKIWQFSMVRRIYRSVGIDKQTHQIIDYYRYGSIFGNLTGAKNISIFWRPSYYQFFDTHSAPALNELPAADISKCRLPVFFSLRHPVQALRFLSSHRR